VIYGARPDGSAKVLLDIIRSAGQYDVVGFLDDDRARHGTLAGLPVHGGRERLPELTGLGIHAVAFAVGDNHLRAALVQAAIACGLAVPAAIHARAVVASGVQIGDAVWMAAGAVVNPGVSVGQGVVINTGATIDHDCSIEDYANVSPGCHLSGRTSVGQYAFLGTGVVTLPDAVIHRDSIVGAGAVVLRSVSRGATAVGVPARELPRPRKTY